MKKKIVAIVASLAMSLGGSVALADPASAHVTRCSKTVIKPMQTSYPDRIMGGARGKCPVDGHQTSIEVSTWIEVYAPRWDRWGDGDWRRLGPKDYDVDTRLVAAAPVTAKLYGRNKYRTRAIFSVDGPEGARNYDIKTSGVDFVRYSARR